MDITGEQIQIYVALLQAAYNAGVTIYAEVKGLLHRTLTPEENAQVLAVWEDNERRSAANAGLD